MFILILVFKNTVSSDKPIYVFGLTYPFLKQLVTKIIKFMVVHNNQKCPKLDRGSIVP